MRIFKYIFMQEIEMPIGAQILTIQKQQNDVCIWALVNPENNTEKRKFETIGTGWEIVQPEKRKYITTLQEMGGSLIWHYFEITE